MLRYFIAAAGLALATGSAHATSLTVISGTPSTATDGSNIMGTSTIFYGGPVGQSFKALDTNLTSFGFQFVSSNLGSANGPITLTIRAGEGLTGAIIGTFTGTPALVNTSSTIFWYDFDTTGTTLTIGQTYSALLTSPSARLGVVFGPNNTLYGQQLGGDAYADGKLLQTNYMTQLCAANGNCDTNFRFSGTTAVAAVPEASAWAMMIVGFGMVGGALRRRRVSIRFA